MAPLRGEEKQNHATPTIQDPGTSNLGILFKLSDEHPCPLYMGVLTPDLAAYVLIIKLKLEGVLN